MTTRAEKYQPETDPVEHAIAWHDGDARAAIRTLLDDCAHLRQQLAMATAAMGHGYTRGWRPDGERDGASERA